MKNTLWLHHPHPAHYLSASPSCCTFPHRQRVDHSSWKLLKWTVPLISQCFCVSCSAIMPLPCTSWSSHHQLRPVLHADPASDLRRRDPTAPICQPTSSTLRSSSPLWLQQQWALCWPLSSPSCRLSSSNLAVRIIKRSAGQWLQLQKGETVERRSKLKRDERLRDADPHSYQHRGRAVRVPRCTGSSPVPSRPARPSSPLPRVVAQPVVLTNYQKLFAGKAHLWQLAVPFSRLFQRRWRPIYFSVGPAAPGRAALDDKHRVRQRHVHDPSPASPPPNGGLCAGKKALRRPQAALHPHRLLQWLPKRSSSSRCCARMSALNLYNTI